MRLRTPLSSSHDGTLIRKLLATFAVMMLLAACTGDAATDTTTSAGDDPDTTEAAPGDAPEDGDTDEESGSEEDATADVNRLVIGTAPPTGEAMNVNRDIQPQDEFQLKPMYENLIGIDPETGAWIPMLAESWELEGNELTFHLRQGVQFHNDFGEMTAEDVLFTYEDLTVEEGVVSGSHAPTLRAAVDDIEIVDDYTMVWSLTDPSYAMFEVISYGAAGLAIKSADDANQRGTTSPGLDDTPIAGTGPYQFVERNQGENVVFERVPYDHWRVNPDFEEIEFRYMAENSSRMAALSAGEIHATSLPQDLEEAAIEDGAEVIESAVPGRRMGLSMLGCYWVEEINPDLSSAEVFTSGELLNPDSPFCDRTVRRAVNKAIDRDALNQAFYGGEAEKIAMWYFPPEIPFNPEWEERWDEMYGYDPDMARELLAEAGYESGGPSIEVFATPDEGGPEAADLMEAVGAMLADVGFDVEIVSQDGATHRERRESRGCTACIEFDSTSSEPITGFEAQGYGNFPSYRAIANVELDTMYEEVLVTLDPDEQAELWVEFGDMVYEEFQHVPLLREGTTVVVDPDVVGGWTFPGTNMSTEPAHVEYITAAD